MGRSRSRSPDSAPSRNPRRVLAVVAAVCVVAAVVAGFVLTRRSGTAPAATSAVTGGCEEDRTYAGCLERAKAGDPRAQFRLAEAYDGGEGVPEDDAAAAEWYRRAAEQGHREAQFQLATLYDSGKGVTQDACRGRAMVRARGRPGDGAGAVQPRAHVSEGRRRAGARHGRRRALVHAGRRTGGGRGAVQPRRGLPDRRGREARMSRRRHAGTERPQTRAMPGRSTRLVSGTPPATAWRETGQRPSGGICQAATQGHAEAQNDLAVIYDAGDGVAENDMEAVRWYRRAAAAGNLSAQHNLGLMYANGEGVRRDDGRAYLWLSVAAAASGGTHRPRAARACGRRLPATARASADRLAAACRESAFKDCSEPAGP